MFKTVTRKTQEVRAVAGAAVSTVKVLRREHKEIANAIKECYPMLSKKEQKAYTNELFAFKVNHGLVKI